MRRWTIKETEDLKELYNKLDNEKLIEFFDRSYISIFKKARTLGINKSPEIEFENRSKARQGEKGSNWKGGRKKNKDGYVLILNKEHPKAERNGCYIFEHVLVMEKHLNRYITDGEVVHHINGIKDDNRIENLQNMSLAEHIKLHHTGKKRSIETRQKISQKTKERHNLKEII